MGKSRTKVTVNTGGIFFSMLAVLFIGLKLTHFIDWSWLWVLAPLWGPAVFGIGIILGIIFVKAIFR